MFELTLMEEVELEAMLILDYIGHRRNRNWEEHKLIFTGWSYTFSPLDGGKNHTVSL